MATGERQPDGGDDNGGGGEVGRGGKMGCGPTEPRFAATDDVDDGDGDGEHQDWFYLIKSSALVLVSMTGDLRR